MKRGSHRSGHAAMLGLKACKGFQGQRIADHARDLPAGAAVGGLAGGLIVGLHGSDAGDKEVTERRGRNFRVHQLGMRGCEGGERDAVFAQNSGDDAEGNGIAGAEVVKREVGSGQHHFISPKRANPADESSFHVTSYASTPFAKEILNGGRP